MRLILFYQLWVVCCGEICYPEREREYKEREKAMSKQLTPYEQQQQRQKDAQAHHAKMGGVIEEMVDYIIDKGDVIGFFKEQKLIPEDIRINKEELQGFFNRLKDALSRKPDSRMQDYEEYKKSYALKGQFSYEKFYEKTEEFEKDPQKYGMPEGQVRGENERRGIGLALRFITSRLKAMEASSTITIDAESEMEAARAKLQEAKIENKFEGRENQSTFRYDIQDRYKDWGSLRTYEIKGAPTPEDGMVAHIQAEKIESELLSPVKEAKKALDTLAEEERGMNGKVTVLKKELEHLSKQEVIENAKVKEEKETTVRRLKEQLVKLEGAYQEETQSLQRKKEIEGSKADKEGIQGENKLKGELKSLRDKQGALQKMIENMPDTNSSKKGRIKEKEGLDDQVKKAVGVLKKFRDDNDPKAWKEKIDQRWDIEFKGSFEKFNTARAKLERGLAEALAKDSSPALEAITLRQEAIKAQMENIGKSLKDLPNKKKDIQKRITEHAGQLLRDEAYGQEKLKEVHQTMRGEVNKILQQRKVGLLLTVEVDRPFDVRAFLDDPLKSKYRDSELSVEQQKAIHLIMAGELENNVLKREDFSNSKKLIDNIDNLIKAHRGGNVVEARGDKGQAGDAAQQHVRGVEEKVMQKLASQVESKEKLISKPMPLMEDQLPKRRGSFAEQFAPRMAAAAAAGGQGVPAEDKDKSKGVGGGREPITPAQRIVLNRAAEKVLGEKGLGTAKQFMENLEKGKVSMEKSGLTDRQFQALKETHGSKDAGMSR